MQGARIVAHNVNESTVRAYEHSIEHLRKHNIPEASVNELISGWRDLTSPFETGKLQQAVAGLGWKVSGVEALTAAASAVIGIAGSSNLVRSS